MYRSPASPLARRVLSYRPARNLPLLLLSAAALASLFCGYVRELSRVDTIDCHDGVCDFYARGNPCSWGAFAGRIPVTDITGVGTINYRQLDRLVVNYDGPHAPRRVHTWSRTLILDAPSRGVAVRAAALLDQVVAGRVSARLRFEERPTSAHVFGLVALLFVFLRLLVNFLGQRLEVDPTGPRLRVGSALIGARGGRYLPLLGVTGVAVEWSPHWPRHGRLVLQYGDHSRRPIGGFLDGGDAHAEAARQLAQALAVPVHVPPLVHYARRPGHIVAAWLTCAAFCMFYLTLHFSAASLNGALLDEDYAWTAPLLSVLFGAGLVASGGFMRSSFGDTH